jgi:hypothetical protein
MFNKATTLNHISQNYNGQDLKEKMLCKFLSRYITPIIVHDAIELQETRTVSL